MRRGDESRYNEQRKNPTIGHCCLFLAALCVCRSLGLRLLTSSGEPSVLSYIYTNTHQLLGFLRNATSLKLNKKFANWLGRRQDVATIKFDPKPSEAVFSTVLSNWDKWRLEAAGDVISGVAVASVGMDAPAKFGGSKLDSG